MSEATGSGRDNSEGKYRREKLLGEGTWGHVFLARRQIDNLQVAVKRIKPKDAHLGLNFTGLREIRFLKVVKSVNIVDLYDIFISDGNLNLVLEFCPSNLEKVIRNKSIYLDTSHVKAYMTMLLNGMSCLHERFIIHRDLKPENLLIGTDNQLKIADFGLARTHGSPNPMSNEVVSLWYRAPELLLGTRYYSEAIDMWSIGCIFGELMLRSPLFPGIETPVSQLSKIYNVLGNPTEETWPGVTTLPAYVEFESRDPLDLKQLFPKRHGMVPSEYYLLMKLLAYDPRKRFSVREALEDRYFHEDPVPCRVEDLPHVDPGSRPGIEEAGKRKREVASNIGDDVKRLRP